MPVEIEAKMRLKDLDAIRARLQALKAKHLANLVETNTFYDTTDAKLQRGDEGLRVRVERSECGSHTVTVTHKGPRAHGKLKSRQESEVVVAAAADAAQLLSALGYHATAMFEKQRERWLLNDCRVELDTLPFLGHYIEIEGPSDEEVLAVREALGLADAELINASYITLLVAHAKEHGLDATAITFTKAAEKSAPAT